MTTDGWLELPVALTARKSQDEYNEEIKEHQEKMTRLRAELARGKEHLAEARARLAWFDRRYPTPNHRLRPLIRALDRIKEVLEDLRELVYAASKYVESDEAENGETQDQNRTNNGKRKLDHNNPSRFANANAGFRKQGSFLRPDKRSHRQNYERALQEPIPKDSTPGRPVNHTWDPCYFMCEFRRQLGNGNTQINPYEENLTGLYNQRALSPRDHGPDHYGVGPARQAPRNW